MSTEKSRKQQLLEELEALSPKPTAEEIEAQEVAELERELEEQKLLARAKSSLGKPGEDFVLVKFPEGVRFVFKHVRGAQYQILQDKDDIKREDLIGLAKAALWDSTPAALDAALERWPNGIVVVSEALASLAGAGRVKIVGKSKGC